MIGHFPEPNHRPQLQAAVAFSLQFRGLCRRAGDAVRYAKERAHMTTATLKWLTRCLAATSTMGGLVLAGELQAQDFTYTTNNGTITITGYIGANPIVIIPETINSLPVTSIGASSFFDNQTAASLTIPNSVLDIGDDAFANCSSLTNAVLPLSVTNLGSAPFARCYQLTKIEVDAQNITMVTPGLSLGAGTLMLQTSLPFLSSMVMVSPSPGVKFLATRGALIGRAKPLAWV